jgi:hypothetical protein
MIPDSTFNRVAQLSHTGWGLAIVFGGKVIFHGRWYLLLAALWIAYAAVKEFWWDQRYENPEERGSSGEDFLFATGAAMLAVAIVFAIG